MERGVDKLDITKLEFVNISLKKLIDIVDNDVIKKLLNILNSKVTRSGLKVLITSTLIHE